MGGAAGLRPSAPTISGGSGLRFIPPSLYSPSKALHLSNIIDASVWSRLWCLRFSNITSLWYVKVQIFRGWCGDLGRSLSFGQQQDQLFKVKYITSSISRRPPAFSEDVWTVQSSSSLRCSLLSSHPNPVRIFRRGNRIFQLTWTSEHFSGGSGLCRAWNIYIISVKERENKSINATQCILEKLNMNS